MLTIIVAMTEDRVIGENNAIPWHCPEDLAHFKEYTLGKTVVMGRKTFESIGKPLPGRRNIVVTNNVRWFYPEVDIISSVDEVVKLSESSSEEIVVIGGAKLYSSLLPFVDKMIVSLIPGSFSGDTWFPEFSEKDFKIVHSDNKETFTVNILERIRE